MKMGFVFGVVAWAAMVAAAAPEALCAKEKQPPAQHARKAHRGRHGAAKAPKKTEPFVNQGPMPAEAESPAREPTVVAYEGGALAITAQDAPLREILDKVQESTGATVEAPALEQRVTVRVPAQAPVQAVAALIEGLGLDYAMLGGTNVNDPVQRIILSPRLAAGHAPGTAPRAAISGEDTAAVQQRTPAMIQLEQTGGDEGVAKGVPGPPENPARARRRD